MPTYEYSCKNCGETFEVFQSFSEKPLKKHKTCGGDLKKVFHVSGIVFKGSGFYATDVKGAASRSDNGSGESKSDSKGESKTDKKPEKKSDKKSDKTADKKPAATT